jgi:nucleoid DNA-binding protein
MDVNFEKAIAAVIRKQIVQKNQISIEGLGSFNVKHIKQSTGKGAKGKMIVSPPRDVIVFTPVKEGA